MFFFTPLLGAQSDSPATQSLIELDNDIKILIDVGWDTSFDVKMLAELERHTPSIDLILLTHPTLEHMGAYAHACKHIPGFSSIAVYATFPVSNLGRLLLQDIYLSTPKSHTRLLNPTSSTSVPYPPNPSTKLPPGATAFVPPEADPELPEDALKLPPTPTEIDSYCGKIVTLKYSQPTPLHSAVAKVPGKLGSVTITAHSAGHSLGGTMWNIKQAQESIVYAIDWNLSRENCLRGAAFLGGEGGKVQEALLKPTVLVCSAKNAMITNMAGGRRKRDEVLLEAIRKTAVGKGGTVLIPTDSVGRVLELVYLLEHAWRKDPKFSGKGNQGKGVGLYLAGKKVRRLGQVIGSMLEWMDPDVVREFESIAEKSSHGGNQNNRRGGKDQDQKDGQSEATGNKAGPFDFLYLNQVSTPGQLSRALSSNDSRGKVLIASDSSLEWGFSRDALLKLASDEKNMVILTERGEGRGGVYGRLWHGWKDAVSSSKDSVASGQTVSIDGFQELETAGRLRLEGEELDAYQRHMAARRALTSQQQSLMSASGLRAGIDADQDDEDASSSSDDDSDSERQGKALTTATSKKVSQATVMMGGAVPVGVNEKIDIGINILLRGEGIYDFDVRGAKGRNRMFPFQVRRKRVDEYGEVVRPDDYMRAEERQDEDLADDEGEKREETRVMGRKRKWDEEASKGRRGSQGTTETGKRRGAQRRRRLSKSAAAAAAKGDDDYDPEAHDSAEEGEVSESSEEEDEEALTAPSKLAISSATVRIRISATFIDFAGLHDQKSLRMLLPLIDPKKLILVGGKREETKHLAEFYREKAALSTRGGGTATDVFSPQNGNTVNASVDTNAWAVRLGNALSRNLKWQNVRGLGVVHVVGRVAPTEAEPDTKKQKTVSADGEASRPEADKELVLDVLPPALAATTRSGAQPIHVGDIRLADLRRVLHDEGHVAEFKGEGTLLVDGVVIVRKTGVGSVSVEDGGGGVLGTGRGAIFVQVRQKVYAGLAVVTGG